MVKHLTDDELQQFVVDKQLCETTIVEHIHSCSECKMKAEIYQSLITGIKQQPEPAFDFDLSLLVLQQMPVPKTKTSDKPLLWVLTFIGIAIIGSIAYYFQDSFVYLFEGISSIFIYLILITVLTVLAGLFIDMYKNYKKEMKLLDTY